MFKWKEGRHHQISPLPFSPRHFGSLPGIIRTYPLSLRVLLGKEAGKEERKRRAQDLRRWGALHRWAVHPSATVLPQSRIAVPFSPPLHLFPFNPVDKFAPNPNPIHIHSAQKALLEIVATKNPIVSAAQQILFTFPSASNPLLFIALCIKIP